MTLDTTPLVGTQLVEASAGTGKTWNICALYLRLLLQARLQVSQILVVTFTQAATAELRERVRKRLVEALDAARARGRDDAAVAPLELALQGFDEAAIHTIHAFCQRALGDVPFASGVPLQLTLMPDDAELRLEAVHDFWRRHIAGDDAALAPALAAHLARRRDTPADWARLLKRHLAKPLARVAWPAGIDAPPPLDDAALRAAFDAARQAWAKDEVDAIVREAQPRLHAQHYKDEYVDAALQQWHTLLAGDDPLAAHDRLALLSAARLRAKKGLAPVRLHPFFDAAAALLDARERFVDALDLHRLALLRAMLDEAGAQLQAAKRARRVVSYDDMLANLHRRLAAPDGAALAAALRARWPAALIDEFQDTDPLQLAIFRAVYGGSDAPLFYVGDPKQAIYSFRNADLHTYLRARDDAHATHRLLENQRSTPALLDALNGLFTRNGQAFALKGLVYAPCAPGPRERTSFDDASGAVRAPLQLWTLPRGEHGAPLLKARAVQAAAEATAAEIARLLDAGRRGTVRHAGRALAGSDIAVLVRTHAQGSAVRRALGALGVASVELNEESLYASLDAEELERVLAAVLEPTRDRLLRAALATGLLGADAADIERLAHDEPALLAQLQRFAEYHALWRRRGIGTLLRRLLHDGGVAARLLARADGERRMTNLLHLAECLHEAAALHATPEALLRWLRVQRSEAPTDDAVQLRLESDRHLVQVLTIHKSKGLEFPLVFCPFLWDGSLGPQDGKRGPYEYHDDDGTLVVEHAAGEASEAVKRALTEERFAESLRLAYVALTRAVHRLHVVIGPYALTQGRSTKQSCRAPINWLVAGGGDAARWVQSGKDPVADVAAVDAAWRALADAAPASIALAPLPDAPGRALDPQHPAPDTLAARDAPARIAPPWWIGSYSALAHGAVHEAAAVDHDARVEPRAARRDAAADADDIAAFPRGAAAGECLHAVFERADFADAATWDAAIDDALRLHPLGVEPARARVQLRRMLADVLGTPLGDGFALADIPAARRVAELEFHLPSARVPASRIAALLRDAGYPVHALAPVTLDGWLHGFIDLVFEHAGRYWVLDWKGNHLGHTTADYAAAPVAEAMRRHGYHLQSLLYALALHRHLQQRLPGYDAERQFGGVLYLFVRGVRPGWRNADGTPSGVHRHRPRIATLDALAALLDGRAEEAA